MKSVPTLLCGALLGQSAVVLGSGYTNESEVPLYGQSPPVYPSPVGTGNTTERWRVAYEKARALVSQFTLEEKVNVTRGHKGQCVGNTGEVPRLGFPALCLSDAPDGVRGNEFVSAFPAGIHVAATWNADLMHKYGKALGEEYRAKGINVALGPVAGPLGRVVRGGRNWEGLSPDPYLAGVGMGAITKGIQDMGVMSSIKHFLLNEQEWRRLPGDMGEALSSNVDDRTLHELYAFPFMDGVREGAVSVMCSYQRVNNSYGCQNSALLNGVLKTEFGFQGFVVSDWQAQHSGVASANAGLDVVMPDAGFWGQNLTNAVNNGSVSDTRVTDMATRIAAAYYYLDQDKDFPAPGVYSNLDKHDPIDAQFDHASLIREIGAAGTVLVKNKNNALPLQKPRFLYILGQDATVSSSPWVNPSRFGGGYEVNFGWETYQGTLVTGGGSGGSAPAYVVSPFEAIRARMAESRGILRWDFDSVNPTPYVNADACLVFINAYASEAFDRKSLTDEFSDQLVQNTAANCSNTIVVIHSAGIRTVDAWIDHPNVTAVVYAGLPGQESGHSIVDILWGDVAPSGKLPYTVARKEEDYGAVLNATVTFDAFPQDDFVEGLYIDYRDFDRRGVEPLFEFGFGLSYTTFAYGDLRIEPVADANTEPLPDAAADAAFAQIWDTVANVTCTIANTGNVTAAEVAQLYVGFPEGGDFETPVRQLRGFAHAPLEPGCNRTVSFPLTRRDLSVWDVTAQQWRLQEGAYKIYVGASSRDLRLNDTLVISAAA